MKREQIIRAWKDEDYRLSMSEAELSALPENPAGLIELADGDLAKIDGLSTHLLIEVLVSVVTIAGSNIASCYKCATTLDGGGTCGMLTAGCC